MVDRGSWPELKEENYQVINCEISKNSEDVPGEGSIKLVKAVSMPMHDGKMANDIPKVDSYRAFQRKMAKSLAQITIFTSFFLKNQ